MSEAEDPPVTEPETTELAAPPGNDPDAASERVVRSHTLWAVCAGAMPLPLFDVAAVTAVQMDALKQLAKVHGIDYSESTGKRFVTALAGGTFARIGASLIKVIPGVGSVVGGLSMMALSGASTYAVCQVAINHFKEHDDFLELDFEIAKNAYREALEKGKEVVKSFEGKEEEAQETYRLLKELEDLRDANVLTEDEFEAKTAELLRKI